LTLNPVQRMGSKRSTGLVVRTFAKKPEPLHTVKEAANILNVSEKTVRRLIDNGLLRSIKIGGLVRVAPTDLDDLIRDHRSR
jgi:excisionase family DNA binding protein